MVDIQSAAAEIRRGKKERRRRKKKPQDENIMVLGNVADTLNLNTTTPLPSCSF